MTAVPQPSERFTAREYQTWPDSERWELIHGEAYEMAPAPAPKHQEACRIIMQSLSAFLKDKPCRPFMAPVDVYLPEPGQNPVDLNDVDTIVQPDLLVVCDKAQILPDKGIVGAPALLIEMLSPWSVTRDLVTKRALYQAAGVKEYWAIDHALAFVAVFLLENGSYGEGKTITAAEVLESTVLPGFSINLNEIRAELNANLGL